MMYKKWYMHLCTILNVLYIYKCVMCACRVVWHPAQTSPLQLHEPIVSSPILNLCTLVKVFT